MFGITQMKQPTNFRLWTYLTVYVLLSFIMVNWCVNAQSAQESLIVTLNPAQPIIDKPFQVYTEKKFQGYKLFASKNSICHASQAVSNSCSVDSTRLCTFNITRNSLSLSLEEIEVQQLYWCTASSNTNVGTFSLYLVEVNPRFYWQNEAWNITISDALPAGSTIGYSYSDDCSALDTNSFIVTNNITRTYAWNDPSQGTVTLCAKLPTGSSSSADTSFKPINRAVIRISYFLSQKTTVRYNIYHYPSYFSAPSFALSTNQQCNEFAQYAQLNSNHLNISVPAGKYYICALQSNFWNYGIYIPSSNTITVRDYSVSPRILYASQSTSMTLSNDAQSDNVKMGLFSNTGGQLTQIIDWSSSPIWNVSAPGVYEAWSQNSSDPTATWFSRTIVVRPTPLIKINPVPIKLGLSAQAIINRSDVLLPSGYIGVTLQTESGLIVANNSTLTNNTTLQVAPGAAQRLHYNITVPYNTTCPTQQVQNNVNDDDNSSSINCQPYSYTIGSVSAVPYYLQYTPLIAKREVNFTLDDTVTLRTGATIKFVPYNKLCTDVPINSSFEFVLNDPSIRNFTLSQFPFSGIWQFCINEVNNEDNGFKSVLELTVQDNASVTPLSFIPGLPATVTVTRAPANTTVYLTKSTTCNNENVVNRTTSNATGVAILSFNLTHDENDVLLVCVEYDAGMSQSSVISVGQITPSQLSFTPTSLINKHTTQVDFEVNNGSQLSSGAASAYITSSTQCDNSAGSILSQSVIYSADNTPYTKPYARFFVNIENIINDDKYNMCVCYRDKCVFAGNINIVNEMTLTTLPSTATAGLPVSVQLSNNAFIAFLPDTFVIIPMISVIVSQDRCAQYSDGQIRSYANGSINSNGQTTQEFTLPVNVSRAVMCVRNSHNAISFVYAGTISFYPFTSRSRFVQIGRTNKLNTWPEPSSTASLYLIPYVGSTPVDPNYGKSQCCNPNIQRYYIKSTEPLDNDTPTGSYILCESSNPPSQSCDNNYVTSSNNTIYAVTPWSLTLPSTPIRQYVTFEVELGGGNGYRPLHQYAMQYTPNLEEEEESFTFDNNDNNIDQTNVDVGITKTNRHYYTPWQHISPFVNQLADINTPYQLYVIPASTTCASFDISTAEHFNVTSTLKVNVTINNITPITQITFCLLPSDDDRITLNTTQLQTYMSPSTIVSQEATLITPGNNTITATQRQAKLSDNAQCNGAVSNIALLSTSGNYYNLTFDGCFNDIIKQMTEVYFCESISNTGASTTNFRNMGKASILRRSTCPTGGVPASITSVITPPASPITSFGINTYLLSEPFLSRSSDCTPLADNTTLTHYGYSPELNENATFYVCANISANVNQLFTTLTPTFQVKNWEITPSSVLSRYNATMGALPVIPQLHISHVVPSSSKPFISLSQYCNSSLMSASPFITENATLPFSTTAINGMAYVCLSSSAQSIVNPTISTPFAIAQFLVITPPTITFLDFALFAQVPFTVSLVVNAYGLNNPLYSMIPGADANYIYHNYYVTPNRSVFFALEPDCTSSVISNKVNVSSTNNSATLEVNTLHITEPNVALCAETAAGVTFLTNVLLVNGLVYPKTLVTGIESTLYIPSKPNTEFNWSAINSGCDNIDNSMQSFTTNSSGYATVNMTRTDDGSSVPVGNYTLCQMISSGSTSTDFSYKTVDTITVVPMLHYNVKGSDFIVNVSSMVYLLDNLSVDKLYRGFTEQQNNCDMLTDKYGNWSKVTGNVDRIKINPNSTSPNPLYLCARVPDNNTKVTVPLDAAHAFNFVTSPFALPANGFDMCSTQTIQSCYMPGSNTNADGIIGIIAGDCCNAQDTMQEKWIGWSSVNTVNHTCTFTWNNSLRSSFGADTLFSVCAWKSNDPYYCSTLHYTSIAGCGSGDIAGGTGALPGWLIAVIVICVILFILLVLLILLAICWRCNRRRQLKQMEQDEKNLQLVAISDYDLDVVQTYYGSERSLHNPLSYIPPTTATTTTTTTSSESANSLSDHALMMSRLHEEQQQNQQQQQQQQHNHNLQRDSNSPNTLSSQDILTNGTSSNSWPSCYSILVACMTQEDEQRQAIALEENRTFYEVRENLRNQLAQLRNDYKRAHAEVGYEDTSDELSFGQEVPVLRKVVVPPHPASTPLHDYKNGSSESNEMLSSLPKSSTSSTNHVNNNNNNITSSSSSSSTSALAKANKEFHKRRTSQSSELTSSSARRRSTGVYIINSESLQHIHLPRNFDENVDAVLNSDSDNEHNHITKQKENKNNDEEMELNSLRRSAPREIKARGALRSKQEMNAQHKMKRRSPNNVNTSGSNNNTPNSDTGSNNDDDVLTIHNDPCEPHSSTNVHHKKELENDDELDHDELDSHSQCIINVNDEDDEDDDNDNNEEDETLLTINTPAPRKVGAKVSNEKSNFAPLQLQNSHDNNKNHDSNDEKDNANPTHTIHMVPLIYDNTTDDESNDEIDINKNSSSSPTKAMDSRSMNNSTKNNANGMSSSKDEHDTKAFHQQDQSTHSSDESFLSYTTTQHYHDEVQFFYKQESIRRQRLVNWEEEARDIIAQSALSDYFRTLAEEGNYSDDSSDDDADY